MFKRLFLVSFAVLLGVSSILLLPTSASAASDYGITLADSLVIGGVDSSTTATCSEQDISTTYISKWTDTTEYQTNQYGVAVSQIDAFKTRLQSNLTAGAGWIMILAPNDTGTGAPTARMYLFDPSRTVTVGNMYLQLSGGGGMDIMDIYRNPSNCDQYRSQSMGGHTGANSINLTAGEKIFILSASDVIYPSDYSGPLLPDSWQPAPPKKLMKPDFSYSIDNFNLSAQDHSLDLPKVIPDEGYTFAGFNVEWSLFSCSSWDDVTSDCTDQHLENYQMLVQDAQYSFTLPKYGDYRLEATYMAQECYRYPSYPATPDYCFMVDLRTAYPDLDFTGTYIHFKADGGSYTGDTAGMECTVAGFCASAADLCFAMTDQMEQLQCRFRKQFNLGLINPSLSSFKNLFTSFTVSDNPQCSIPMPDVRILGSYMFPLSTFSSTACAKIAVFRVAFPIVSLFLNFLLAISILFLVVRIINRLLDVNKTDIIEGV